jgi:Arc/MetJ-type ribon-helix-helix transcriptional regulator
MEVTLSESLVGPVQERVKQAGYSDVDEYVNALIQVDLLEQMLIAGVRSGPPIMADDAYWEAKRQRLIEGRSDGR